MQTDPQPEQQAALATSPPEPPVVRVRIANPEPPEVPPVLASLALQCPDRRAELASLDVSRDVAAVFLRDTGRPADLQFRPIIDYHPDLALIAAHVLDADASAVISLVVKRKSGEEVAFAFEAPARDMPAQEPHPPVSGNTSGGREPVSPAPTPTREEFKAALQEIVAPLAEKIAQLEAERAQAKPATREELYAQRAAEYDAALHENMLSELKSRKKIDPDEIFDKMMERQEKFTERLFQGFQKTQALAQEYMPPAPEKQSLGEKIVEEGLTLGKKFIEEGGKEPFRKKGAA